MPEGRKCPLSKFKAQVNSKSYENVQFTTLLINKKMKNPTDSDTHFEDGIFNRLNIIIEKKAGFKNNLLNKEDYFFNNFLPDMKNCLDRETLLYVCFLVKKYNGVLDELRNNNFEFAEIYLSEIDSIFSYEPTVPNLIIKTVANNVMAYKAYKYGRNEDVLNLLINSLEIDCMLEEEGFAFMHFHKIQTLHNIARNHLKQNLKSGVNLSLELMKYLSTRQGDFRLGKFVLLQEKNELSADLCRKLFLQIFNDLIFHFVKFDDSNDTYFLEIYRRNLSAIRQKEKYLNFIEEWLNIVVQLDKNARVNNLSSITKFLKHYSDRLACLSVFLIKKLLSIYPSEMEASKRLRSNLKNYGFSI